MSIILNIDTSTNLPSVSISKHSNLLSVDELGPENNISGNITRMIERAVANANIKLSDVDAISINLGPGSYTSLRVGLSTSKGLCYALNKPLIGLNSFEMLASSVTNRTDYDLLICMVDARRMDVYAGIYDLQNDHAIDPEFATIDKSFFEKFTSKKVLCLGDGAQKFKSSEFLPEFCTISDIIQHSSHMISIAEAKFSSKTFLDIAYCVPYYFKPPNITTPKNTF